jgi:hypothetical protein
MASPVERHLHYRAVRALERVVEPTEVFKIEEAVVALRAT